MYHIHSPEIAKYTYINTYFNIHIEMVGLNQKEYSIQFIYLNGTILLLTIIHFILTSHIVHSGYITHLCHISHKYYTYFKYNYAPRNEY